MKLKWFFANISNVLFFTSLFASHEPLSVQSSFHEAFLFSYTDPTQKKIVQKAPPAPIVETPPSKPMNEAIWIPGYWAWIPEKNDYAWICGVWRKPPPNMQWILGSWEKVDGGWVFAKGFWHLKPLSQLSYIQKAPPALIQDNIGDAQEGQSFWVPGYWEYSDATGSYGWLKGKWEPFNQNYVLSPACYVWRPSGYVFVPLYWDYPLDQRGYAYLCNGDASNATFSRIEVDTIIEQCFFYYPNYINIYWHWWHYHPGYWDGCWCMPPWWGWNGWWSLPWQEAWGLWWWWGHPGAFPPFWISLELSLEISPPDIILVDAFKKLSKPPFELKLGDNPLLPKGPIKGKTVPLPSPSTTVDPKGGVLVPPLPQREVTPPVPPPPPPPPVQQTPPSSYPVEPSYPNQEAPPRDHYYPEGERVPPVYYPPVDRHPPHYPSSDKPRPHTPPGDKRPPTTKPPTTKPTEPTYPKYPNYPKGGSSK